LPWRSSPVAGVLAFGEVRGRLRALAFQRRWPAVGQLALVSALVAAAFTCAGEPSPVSESPPASATVEVDKAPRFSASIVSTIRGHQADVKGCYEKAISTLKMSSMRIDVTLAVDTSGEVTGVSLDRSLAVPPSLAECLSRTIRRWQFPVQDGPTRIEFPLFLKGSG